ncbi:lysophospholipid acyltransferase family protein [Pleomorphomonas sp. NRK KF1]|uniref:lysophospholipid acyltransferase family protein n=1 Tax=Pleomorphomonas sp. NRK KF1 TaxID=2943000 RepID=UPI0021130F10|nr:lauroyl acyltransferase [Pleomorphomonas sp. NRK KF1]
MDYRQARTQAGFWLEYAALRVVVALLSLLGVDRASAFMGRIWRWVARFNPRHARADQHLALAMPELTSAQRNGILLDMWENLGRTFAEGLLLPDIVGHPERIAMSEQLAEDIKAIGVGGAVFCSLHQGNWELLAVGSAHVGKSLVGVYRPLKNPLSEAYFRSRRETAYPAGLVAAGTSSVLRMRSLARGGAAIAMMADLPDGNGIVSPFFGHPALLSKLPVTLARRLGLPLVVAHCLRVDGARFRIDGKRLELPNTDDPEADVEQATLALHATFETWIRDEPGQWMWATRKWPKLGL